jgi:hypothetical protein
LEQSTSIFQHLELQNTNATPSNGRMTDAAPWGCELLLWVLLSSVQLWRRQQNEWQPKSVTASRHLVSQHGLAGGSAMNGGSVAVRTSCPGGPKNRMLPDESDNDMLVLCFNFAS